MNADQVSRAAATAAALPFARLVVEIARVLVDPAVTVPARIVQSLPGGASLFVMPALDGRIAITKLITYTPANVGTHRPSIQGDIVVFDAATGARIALLDGPTVTARRTAAVSALAARRLAADPDGPALIIGAGVQGHAHLYALAEVVGTRRFWVASRTHQHAQDLATQARSRGLEAAAVEHAQEVQASCSVVVTCTPANGVVLRGALRPDAFVAAIGAFTPSMVEIDPLLVRNLAASGRVVLDTAHARHEAGDLLQAGIDVTGCHTLADVVRETASARDTAGQPVLFKSCGWAGWDLAAARCTVHD